MVSRALLESHIFSGYHCAAGCVTIDLGRFGELGAYTKNTPVVYINGVVQCRNHDFTAEVLGCTLYVALTSRPRGSDVIRVEWWSGPTATPLLTLTEAVWDDDAWESLKDQYDG